MSSNTKIMKNDNIIKDDIKVIPLQKRANNMMKDDNTIILTPKRVIKINRDIMEDNREEEESEQDHPHLVPEASVQSQSRLKYQSHSQCWFRLK